MTTAIGFRSSAVTHPGVVRSHNEDAFVDRPDLGLWAIADGVGGYAAGEVASGTIAQSLDSVPADLSASDLLAQVRLRLGQAHEALRAEAAERGESAVVAACVVVLIARDTHYACLWAGDCRCYLLREGALARITRDHSLVQDLVDAGAIPADEAAQHPQANVVTRAVGAEDEAPELDKTTAWVMPGDRFLLCSDGLTKAVSEAEIAAALREGGDVAARLVDRALQEGARDNVTVVAVEVEAAT
jgi:serine/threonine protein phosphatase PrpC